MFATLKRKLATIEPFADELVAMISQHLPAPCVGDLEQAAPYKHASRLAHRVCLRSQHFASANDLGLWLRAHLANKVKWGLRARGYDERFIELVTVSMALRPNNLEAAGARGGLPHTRRS